MYRGTLALPPASEEEGDGPRPDLVSTAELVGNDAKVWGDGTSPHWRVFRNVP